MISKEKYPYKIICRNCGEVYAYHTHKLETGDPIYAEDVIKPTGEGFEPGDETFGCDCGKGMKQKKR